MISDYQNRAVQFEGYDIIFKERVARKYLYYKITVQVFQPQLKESPEPRRHSRTNSSTGVPLTAHTEPTTTAVPTSATDLPPSKKSHSRNGSSAGLAHTTTSDSAAATVPVANTASDSAPATVTVMNTATTSTIDVPTLKKTHSRTRSSSGLSLVPLDDGKGTSISQESLKPGHALANTPTGSFKNSNGASGQEILQNGSAVEVTMSEVVGTAPKPEAQEAIQGISNICTMRLVVIFCNICHLNQPPMWLWATRI
jgi:hypothetical protein